MNSKLVFVFVLIAMAVPLFATDIHETGPVTEVSLGIPIPPSTDTNGRFFIGDIVLCEAGSGLSCLSSYAGVDLSTRPEVSDVLRYADINHTETVFLYDEAYLTSNPGFVVYGNTLAGLSAMIAAGFGSNSDLLGIGTDSGTSIFESDPAPTVHGGLNIFSTEASTTPEPATLTLFAAGLAGLLVRRKRI